MPQQTALPPVVSALANACVIETTSGDMLVAALRDAAWTPWQPVDGQDEDDGPRPDLFWKAFDALPVPVLVVDDAGTILHANGACTKLADGVEILGKPLASFFVAEDGPAIAKLIADGFAGGYEDTPVFTAPADGQTVQVVLQALSVLPGAGGQRQLAMRCELRAEAVAPEPPAPAGPDLAAEIAALNESRDELTQIADATRGELKRLCEELEELRGQANAARRERDELRGQLESRSATSSARASWSGRGRRRSPSSSASSPTRRARKSPRRGRRASWRRAPRSCRRCAASSTCCGCARPARAPTPSAPRCATPPSKRPRARRWRS